MLDCFLHVLNWADSEHMAVSEQHSVFCRLIAFVQRQVALIKRGVCMELGAEALLNLASWPAAPK